MSVRGREFKISLFAYDIILPLTQPRISLPNLHAELDCYGSLLGSKINTSKSEALPLNIPATEIQHLISCFPYAWKSTARKVPGSIYHPDFPYTVPGKLPPPFISKSS